MQVENDTIAAAVTSSTDFLGNTLTFSLVKGSPLAGNINGGAFAQADGQNVSVTLSLVSGNWTASTGQSGALDGPTLTNIANQSKANRNAMEAFAISNNLIPGIQVVWG